MELFVREYPNIYRSENKESVGNYEMCKRRKYTPLVWILFGSTRMIVMVFLTKEGKI